MKTVAAALQACDLDGLEFDFEGPGTPQIADNFTTLLIDIAEAIGPEAEVSADSEPPQWTDYYRLNASKLAGTRVFVNYMSYFTGTEDYTIARWVNSISMLLKQVLWSRVSTDYISAVVVHRGIRQKALI